MITRLVVLSMVILMVAAPAFSGEATHIWRCEMNPGVTEEQVIAGAKEWLNAAKKVEGGEGLKIAVYFPVAVNATNQIDILLVASVPSFTDFGRFWDNYPDSPAADVEQKNQEMVVCPDSTLWQSDEVK